MASALRYRLFGMGKMPPELRALSSDPAVLIAAEGLPVTQTVDALKLERASVAHGVKRLVGAVVLLPDRLLLSTGPSVIVDAQLPAPAQPPTAATATAEFSRAGIHLSADVASLVERGSGTIELRYRLELNPSLLAQLPQAPVNGSLQDPAALLSGWKGQWSR